MTPEVCPQPITNCQKTSSAAASATPSTLNFAEKRTIAEIHTAFQRPANPLSAE